MPASKVVVLPETARPSKYRIKLQPDLTTFTFSGEQSVDLQILEPTTSIVLNAIDLDISVATLHANGVTCLQLCFTEHGKIIPVVSLVYPRVSDPPI